MKINDRKWYYRGKDYPMYKNHAKMHLLMEGKELKQWFTEKELEEYKSRTYMGVNKED